MRNQGRFDPNRRDRWQSAYFGAAQTAEVVSTDSVTSSEIDVING
jgi:hypothetical protein